CYDRLATIGRRLMRGIQQQFDAARIPVRVTGEPSTFQPWFTDADIVDHRSTLATNAPLGVALVDRLLDAGIVKAHEKFFVSMAHTDEDIDCTLMAVASAVERLAGG